MTTEQALLCCCTTGRWLEARRCSCSTTGPKAVFINTQGLTSQFLDILTGTSQLAFKHQDTCYELQPGAFVTKLPPGAVVIGIPQALFPTCADCCFVCGPPQPGSFITMNFEHWHVNRRIFHPNGSPGLPGCSGCAGGYTPQPCGGNINIEDFKFRRGSVIGNWNASLKAFVIAPGQSIQMGAQFDPGWPATLPPPSGCFVITQLSFLCSQWWPALTAVSCGGPNPARVQFRQGSVTDIDFCAPGNWHIDMCANFVGGPGSPGTPQFGNICGHIGLGIPGPDVATGASFVSTTGGCTTILDFDPNFTRQHECLTQYTINPVIIF